MKKIKYVAIGLMFLTACAKDIEVCIDGNMNPEAPGSYTYTWCGTNADRIEWIPGWGGGTLTGESVTFDFDHKGGYSFTVGAYNKKSDAFQNFGITVGSYEARVEPKDCSGDFWSYAPYPVKAYAYSSFSSLDTDLKNGDKAGCVDSVLLESSNYFEGTTQSSTAIVGGFSDLPSGNYVIFIETSNHEYNNLLGIIQNPATNTISVSNGESDDVVSPLIAYSPAIFGMISQEYLLTGVWINGNSTPVALCNADDKLIFSAGGGFLFDVGPDDCSGASSSSPGNLSSITSCFDLPNNQVYLYPTSGSWSTANYVSMQVSWSANTIDVTLQEGANTILQTFTAQ